MAIGLHDHVADLSGTATRAGIERTIGDNTTAHAGANEYADYMLIALGYSMCQLAVYTRVSIVLYQDRYGKVLL